MQEKKGVLVVCAHSDDQILGCGGTMAKFARKGIPVYTIIMSYGEKSHPHLQEEYVIKTRVKEAQKANEIIHGKKLFFLGLKESKFQQTAKTTNAVEKIENIIKLFNIDKIFTHSSFDAHPDHIVTHNLVKKITKNLKIDMYSFTVWKLFQGNKKLKNSLKLVVDISSTFKTKFEALDAFRSQKMQMSLPYIQTHINSFFNGLNYGYKFAEVFIKEK